MSCGHVCQDHPRGAPSAKLPIEWHFEHLTRIDSEPRPGLMPCHAQLLHPDDHEDALSKSWDTRFGCFSKIQETMSGKKRGLPLERRLSLKAQIPDSPLYSSRGSSSIRYRHKYQVTVGPNIISEPSLVVFQNIKHAMKASTGTKQRPAQPRHTSHPACLTLYPRLQLKRSHS